MLGILILKFRSALPHGERREGIVFADEARRGFDPRSRTGSDVIMLLCICNAYRRFDPRSRTGSDVRDPRSNRLALWFRSALPHGERHEGRLGRSGDLDVSIRAPARGATARQMCALARLDVSIRAPARGATYTPG